MARPTQAIAYHSNLVVDRATFRRIFWAKLDFKPITEDHPLWIPEHDLKDPCTHFVCVTETIKYHKDSDFWLWCTNTLTGDVRCFSSSQFEEWWDLLTKKIFRCG